VQDVDPSRDLDRVDGAVVSPRSSSTTSSTPADPKPVITLASWCLPPACARSMACPNTSLTFSGIASRSRFAEPTHLTGLRGCFDIESIMPIWAYECQCDGMLQSGVPLQGSHDVGGLAFDAACACHAPVRDRQFQGRDADIQVVVEADHRRRELLAPRDAKRRGGEQRQSTARRAIDGCIEFDERRLRQGSVDCLIAGAGVRFVGRQPASRYVSFWPQGAIATPPQYRHSSRSEARRPALRHRAQLPGKTAALGASADRAGRPVAAFQNRTKRTLGVDFQ
jgi:hypothetical protein